MSAPRQAIVFFCEDTRHELGEKISYMGLIGPQVWVRTGQTMRLRCAFLTWVEDPEIVIDGSFELEGAPADCQPPKPFSQRLAKNPEDQSDRWLIQLVGSLEVKVETSPVILRAKFAIGEEEFSNLIEFDPVPPETFVEMTLQHEENPSSKRKAK